MNRSTTLTSRFWIVMWLVGGSLFSLVTAIVAGLLSQSTFVGWLTFSSLEMLATLVAGWIGLRGTRATHKQLSVAQSQLNAINKVQATIEFNLDGTIVDANENFLRTLGYTLDEIRGKHHSMFVESAYAATAEYRQFWNDLAAGRAQVAEFKRIGKGGKEVWIQASYNPIFDEHGKACKVIKFAIDTTADKLRTADFAGQLDAISKAQAVIEFDLSGKIINANDNFLTTLGYSLNEIKGKHHSMFVEAVYGNSHEYRKFWDDLRAGQYQAGEFKRIGKGGKEVWIQASYNPIFDMNGQPLKVVKYATDVTKTKLTAADSSGQLEAINKAQAVIEFDLNGTIRWANDNFLSCVGYSLSEVQGKHHSIFVAPTTSASPEYRKFWDDLRNGIYQAAQYERVGKGGKKVWIQASYNPILDLNGKPYKVVKYATDITATKEMEFAMRATEDAEQLRSDRERALAQEVERKVAVVLDVVNSVAAGNFSVTIPDLGDDPVGQVAAALATAVDAMRSALSEVRDVAGTVSTAASQLTEASREISSGAQTQASSLEETASSLEEITSTVKQNTDNAQQARQLANGSRDIAERGGNVVSEAVQAMEEINNSSKKIADIITTIDEIAFQTNLLALNAAVEAARAGEQGRGFAVVAAEVRNLAQRSASAAKEIKSLIQDSVNKVQNGTELVNRSGQTLGEIVTSVKRVTDIVAEIAAASKEQLTGIEQVNKAVAQMDRVTQGNATQTEEMSGTAGMLLSHSQQLGDLVSRFQLDGQNSKRLSRRNEGHTETRQRDSVRPSEANLRHAPIVMDHSHLDASGVLEF